MHHISIANIVRFRFGSHKAAKGMRKAVITGWIISLAGTTVWYYGYFVPGNVSIIDWQAHAPWWIADFLPNIESEIGMVLILAGMIPTYWPSQQ